MMKPRAWLNVLASWAILTAPLVGAMPSIAKGQGTAQVLPGGCGTAGYGSTSSVKVLTQNTVGNLCTAASVSASITGFAPATTGTPITATTAAGGVTGALPAGAVVIAFNTGANNTAFCKLGASTTVNDIAIPPNSWFAYTVGAATQISCITSTSTTTISLIGGAGLPTGAGGGAGGSGSNASVGVTGSAVPASATYVGITSGGNLTGWDTTVKQATAANFNATVVGAGSPGSANAGVETIQGIASMTPVLTNPGTAANIGVGATGSAVPANAVFAAGGAAGGAGNLTGTTVKAASTAAVATDTSLVIDGNPNGALVSAVNAGVATPGSATVAKSIQIAGSGSGNANTIVECDSHVFKHITTATDTLAVQGVSAKQIKVCGAMAVFSGSAAQTIFLENTASTNANCSSANTQITGAWVGNSTTPYPVGFYNAFWGGLANTSANGLCINSTGTGGVDVDIWYTQGS